MITNNTVDDFVTAVGCKAESITDIIANPCQKEATLSAICVAFMSENPVAGG